MLRRIAESTTPTTGPSSSSSSSTCISASIITSAGTNVINGPLSVASSPCLTDHHQSLDHSSPKMPANYSMLHSMDHHQLAHEQSFAGYHSQHQTIYPASSVHMAASRFGTQQQVDSWAAAAPAITHYSMYGTHHAGHHQYHPQDMYHAYNYGSPYGYMSPIDHVSSLKDVGMMQSAAAETGPVANRPTLGESALSLINSSNTSGADGLSSSEVSPCHERLSASNALSSEGDPTLHNHAAIDRNSSSANPGDHLMSLGIKSETASDHHQIISSQTTPQFTLLPRPQPARSPYEWIHKKTYPSQPPPGSEPFFRSTFNNLSFVNRQNSHPRQISSRLHGPPEKRTGA